MMSRPLAQARKGWNRQRMPMICRSIACVAAAVALVRVAIAIPTFTNIVDEPYHIGAAVALWDVGKHTLGTEHPPLPRLVAGLPLRLAGVRLPEGYRNATVRSEPESLEIGARVLFDNGALRYAQVLHRARLAMLVFPALAMFYLYLLARWAACRGSPDAHGAGAAAPARGELVAMLAVLFFSLDPTLLGHAFWVTTDAAACAGFLAATYHGLRWIESPTMPRALAAGAALGLAIACKFTCLLIIPGLILIMLFRRRAPRPRWQHTALAALVAFVALWGTYLFDVSPMSDQTAFGNQALWQSVPQWARDAPIPMPSFPLGLLRLLGHNRWGHPAYLNGEISRYGWWYYFPEAIAIKSPLALLAGLAIAVAIIIAMRGRGFARLGQAMAISAVLMGTAMLGHLNIGVRHVLPLIPLLYLLVCATLAMRRATLVILLLLIATAAAETAAVHPDYVAFFNLTARGPRGGARYLLDSNLDWGQDVGRLATWLRTSDAARGRRAELQLFAYPEDRLLRELELRPPPTAQPRADSGGILLIISKNVEHGLTGIRMNRDGTLTRTEDYSWLARHRPLARIGRSIEVYELEPTGTASAER